MRNAFGIDVRIAMTAIDTGFNTHRVYNYVRQHRADGVMAVKGAKIQNRPILTKPTRQDVKNDKGVLQKNGVQLWMVGADTAKAALFARLAGDEQEIDGVLVLAAPSDRMVRFPAGLPDEFYDQMTAEVFDDRSGLWVKIRARNEDLDTWVYACAAACHPSVRINRLQTADWEHLRQMIEPRMGDLFSAPVMVNPDTGAEAVEQEVQTSAPVAQPVQQTTTPQRGTDGHDDWLGGTDNWLD